MTIKYTKEQLNKFDKDLLIELFLGMQGLEIVARHPISELKEPPRIM